MQILGRLGLDGWKLVGAPQFDQSYVYLLMTVDKGSPPKRIENSASSWMARTFWLMREVDGC
jgi:hypothetical protein